MKLSITSLALGAFAIGVTEFTPMGLLPYIANDLHVSVPAAGMLVSAYAAGVMVGAPIITLLLSANRRKVALIGLMLLFTLGNLLSVFATNYELLLASRLLTSLSHGAFFGIGAMVAASLVPPEKKAAAVSSMFMGLTIANIGGVPAATWLGHVVGWRTAFLATAILGVLTCTALLLALPLDKAHKRPNIARELKILARWPVIKALLTTAFAAGAMFTLYTYIAAVLENITHASANFVTSMLVVIGVGFTLGNMISGRLADKALKPTLAGFLLILAATSLVFPFAATSSIGAAIALLIWGAATFGVAAPVQMQVMNEAHEAAALASSVNIGAFNLGNALGAAVGGAVLSTGLGFQWIAPAGGALALLALVLTLLPSRTGVRLANI